MATDLFHLISEFEKVNIKNEVGLYLVHDQFQELTYDTCGLLELYFQDLFNPLHNSNISNDDKLTKDIILKLLNEHFSLNREENEARVERFPTKHSITTKSKKLKNSAQNKKSSIDNLTHLYSISQRNYGRTSTCMLL